jgi:hypothetical protein
MHQAESFESQLADFGFERLARREAFQFFRQLVNYDLSVLSAATPSTPEAYLDYFVADSPVDCHRDHLTVGAQQIKVLSMKEPPGQTFAHTLSRRAGSTTPGVAPGSRRGAPAAFRTTSGARPSETWFAPACRNAWP